VPAGFYGSAATRIAGPLTKAQGGLAGNGGDAIDSGLMASQNAPMYRLLIVDDDPDIREMLSEYLATEGYSVDSTGSGTDAMERSACGGYALIILDIMLPEINGLDVLQSIRARSRTPVLMLTARGEAVDRVVGLRLGADDYVAKPFLPQELAARVQAILRRANPNSEEPPSALELGDVFLDIKSRSVKVQGQLVELTSVEFDLLYAFLSKAGQVINREALQRQVLGREYSPFDRSIDTHVSNLRRKLGPTTEGTERIKSIRGTGYQYSYIPYEKA
jgi:two-component system, OmpR family, response regulator CpxR